MAKIDELLAATDAGFIAVATRRNLDVENLEASIANADLKADGAITQVAGALAAVGTANDTAVAALASADSKLLPSGSNVGDQFDANLKFYLNDLGITTTPAAFRALLNQDPSLLNFTGGVISNIAATNTAALRLLIQYAGVKTRTKITLPPGEILIDDTIVIDVANVVLEGRGKDQTIIRSSKTNGDGVRVTASSVTMKGLCVYVPGQTAGSAISWQSERGAAYDIQVLEAFTGFEAKSVGVFHGGDWRIYNCASSGLYLNGNTSAGVQGFSLDTADISSGNPAHFASGGVRIEGFVSAPRLTKVEVLGGKSSLSVNGPTTIVENTNPGYGVFTACFFDGAAESSFVSYTLACEFVACEFSGGRTGTGFDALVLTGNKALTFTSGKAAQAGRHGVVYNDNSSVTFVNFHFLSNGYIATDGRGVSMTDNSKGLVILGGTIAGQHYNSGNDQKYGFVAGGGCEATLIGVTFKNNLTLPVFNLSSSTKLVIIACPGAEGYERHSVGGGAVITKQDRLVPTIDPASVPAQSVAAQTFTVAGLALGDLILSAVPRGNLGLTISGARVSGADTLSVTLANPTAAAVDPPSLVWDVLIQRNA